MKKKIGIIGGGNMGEALISALCKKYALHLCEKSLDRAIYLRKKYKIRVMTCEDLAKDCDVVILATKPQDLDRVLMKLRKCEKKALFISIAAGMTIKHVERHLAGKQRVIRVMPNLPVKVQMGITAVCKGRYADDGDLRITCQIFSFLGKTVVVKERLINGVTAVSGSGPGYFYLFAEELIKAAQSLGMSSALAKMLVLETFLGSAFFLKQSKQSPSVLRAQVTSKGGTTEAALEVFYKNKVGAIFQKALLAAASRAEDLSKG